MPHSVVYKDIRTTWWDMSTEQPNAHSARRTGQRLAAICKQKQLQHCWPCHHDRFVCSI